MLAKCNEPYLRTDVAISKVFLVTLYEWRNAILSLDSKETESSQNGGRRLQHLAKELLWKNGCKMLPLGINCPYFSFFFGLAKYSTLHTS